MCNESCGRMVAECDTQSSIHGIDRREFVTRSLLSAVASLLATNGLAACGNGIIGGDGITTPTSLGTGTTIKLTDFPTLANIGGIAFVGQVSGTPVAVARTSASTFVALSMICTHQGTTVNIVSGGFRCPNHGATFASDGHWTGGQQTTNLVSYPATYDSAAGVVQIGSGSTGTVSSVPVTAGTSTVNLVVTPSQFPALASIGGIARVDNQQAGTLPIAVVRTGTSSWAAFSMVCPHQGTTINIVSGGFLCPNHGAKFNSAGANTGGQQTSSLTSLPVTVQSNGTLLISGTATSGGSSGGQRGDD